jgi:hypothetical protein
MLAELKRVLVAVKTYPNPSTAYDETVCTAVTSSALTPSDRTAIGRIGSSSGKQDTERSAGRSSGPFPS